MIRLTSILILTMVGNAFAQPGATPLARDLDEPTSPPAAVPTPPAEHGYVGGGVLVGATSSFINLGLVAEGGLKLGGSPLWLHGVFARGDSFDFEGGGPLTRGMLGIDLRGCSSPGFCGFIGVDAGYQELIWSAQDEMTEDHTGVVFGPHVGIDVGGDHVRARFAFEVLRFGDRSTGDTEWRGGGGFTTTVVYRM